MAITDLTGYTWVGNDELGQLDEDFATYHINFAYRDSASGNERYSSYLRFSSEPPGRVLLYDVDQYFYIHDRYGWYIEDKTLHITGGQDATNTSLIQWFEDNGTLRKITPPLSIKYGTTEIYSGDATSPINITYNGSTIASFEEGTKILRCANKLMLSNVVIGNKTLSCSGKLMSNDISVEFTNPWEYPVQTGNTLLITQAYSISQNDDIVVLDNAPIKEYTVTTSGIATYGFEKTSTPANPDSTKYDGVYRSLNYHVSSSYGVMRIDFVGYTTFNIYIRSYAESNYDYTIASKLDASTHPTQYNDSTAQAHTRGNQQSGTAIGSYTKVSYENDGGSHHIFVVYRKDSSVDTNDDRGYVLIEK